MHQLECDFTMHVYCKRLFYLKSHEVFALSMDGQNSTIKYLQPIYLVCLFRTFHA